MCWPREHTQTQGDPSALLRVSQQLPPRSLQQGVQRVTACSTGVARCWLLLLSAGHSKATCILLQQLRAHRDQQSQHKRCRKNLHELISLLLIQIGSHYNYYKIYELPAWYQLPQIAAAGHRRALIYACILITE